LIDFSSINAFNNGNGQRDSFEDLMCVLARRNPPVFALEFQPNEGSGGDGGVEAFWLLANGKKIGYQAKFFLTLGDPQWRQIDESVHQALEVHPELQKYIIALPRDLTPDRGGRSRGKSERQKWDERVVKWKKLAATKSINIEFELWSETSLKDMLLAEENTSLVKHWFGGDVLNDKWFENQIDVAAQTLDDRFNPGDHVEVSIEGLFDTIARGPVISKRLRDAFTEIEKLVFPHMQITSSKNMPSADVHQHANKLWQKLEVIKSSFSQDFTKEWDIDLATKALDHFMDAVRMIERQDISINKEDIDEGDQSTVERVSRSLNPLSSSFDSLKNIFRDPNLQAEKQKCAVLYGPAGAGKSHILGQIAKQRASEGLPTILVLGQSLSNNVFWEQVSGVLGLEGRTMDDILGNLNAAGERKGVRTIILFDAINEGVGAHYWRLNLPEIVSAIQKYSHLAAVFSCRDEYLSYAFPESLSEKLPKLFINGFSTQDELERAAIQYLDAKGVARPNTPWLSPEFSNPLFLKTASEALLAKGCTEFPSGLNGISEIMALYLDALSWRTGIRTENSRSISNSIMRCVRLIADEMAKNGNDFVEIGVAEVIAERSFKGRTPPDGKTWLQVLIETSVFRRDPPPYSNDSDPFDPPSELVRFSFQRFQDHLMAKSLVSKVAPNQTSAAFGDGGPLNFLFYDGIPDNGFRYEYVGLLSSLSTLYPEEFELEFAKTLPNWEQHWKQDQFLQESFGESFKWRCTGAFSEATRELLNRLDDHYVEPLGLLLGVSMTVDHPYNALRLHSRLKQLQMPERDSYWTRWINWASREEFNQVDRIVSWALSIRGRSTDSKHLELASVVLAWALSSSYQTLRDRSTKALTTLFLENSSIFNFVLEKMHDCDDPYVLERLYAAAFGACCIDQSPERLDNYSREIFAKVFSNKQPPVALLTRDYALGVIELADSKGMLSSDINLADCYHPLGTDAPIFSLTEDEVDKIAEESGGKEIFDSASSEWGDFGKYTIPGRVSCFLTTPLDQVKPISKQELKRIFVEEVISLNPERVEALNIFDEVSSRYRKVSFYQFNIADDQKVIDGENAALAKQEIEARLQLERLLDKDELKRLSADYFQDDSGHEEFSTINIQQCRLWITKRAYELGWNAKLFLRDGQGISYSRHDNDLERIGKKYQRIALDEIQARLADNFWVLKNWPEEACIYRYSNNDYRRDIEPTILPNDVQCASQNISKEDWIIEPIVKLPDVSENDLRQWPFEEDPTLSMLDKLMRIDDKGQRWHVLHEFNIDKQKYEGPKRGMHGMRYEEFRFFYCVFVKQGQAKVFAEFLSNKGSLDGFNFKPSDVTDGPYLGEAYWRDTWEVDKFSERLWEAPEGCEFAIPVTNYCWESHLDKSLPDGFSNYMPQKWFADELGLSMSEKGPHVWSDKSQNVVIQAHKSLEDQKAVVIKEEILQAYADQFRLEPVWLMIAERNTWPNGNNSESCWRRSEGVIWFEDGNWKKIGWNKDTKNERD
jgi:hypothetical protein